VVKPRPDPAAVPLTAKQRLFVEWYCSAEVNMVGIEAARRAGYTGNPNVLGVTANRTLNKPNVKAAIEAKLKKALAGAEVTVESILRRLTVLGEEARAETQYASAVRCAELQGKYLKMFTDRIEHVGTIEDVSTERLVELLRESLERGGLDIRGILAGIAGGDGVLPDRPGAPTTH
jgi:phage terminase small subunit